MSLPPVGAQLIVFGKKYDVNTQIEEILDSLAESGYAAVEGGPRDAAAYRRMLDERGLRYAGSHAGLAALRDTGPLVEYLRLMGSQDVSNSGLLKWGGLTAQDYREAIPLLNEAGRRLKDEGIHLHYHNHAFEFDKVDGELSGMDLLLDGLDFDVLDLCVDVAWVHRGGSDPAEFLRQHRDRIGYLHFKDTRGDHWEELGRGEVDFASIMRVLPEMPKVRWVVVEQDTSDIEPKESMAISRRYLRETFGY